MKNDKKSFILYENYEKLFHLLPMEQRGLLITAIFEYERQQTVSVELSDAANMAFQCIKDTLDRDREAYEEKCKKQSENGKKGGRPSKATLSQKSQKTQCFFEKAKKADNDNGNDNENENENDIDNDTVNGNGIGNGNDNENDPTEQTIQAPPQGTPSPHAPRLTEEELEKLLLEGVESDYIQAREERAVLFAKRGGEEVVDVLRRWWQEDRRSCSKRGKRPKSDLAHTPSYGDVEDFFAVACARAFDDLEAVPIQSG